MERLAEIGQWVTNLPRLRRAVISGRRKNFQPPFQRIDIRPVEIKGTLKLQAISHGPTGDLTSNLSTDQFDLAQVMADGYANLLVELDTEIIQARITKKGELLIHRRANSNPTEVDLAHNRSKRRLLPPDDPIFIALGISDQSGALIPRMSDKFHQVDSFLRSIESVIDDFGDDQSLSVVDLGCGSAYLTFAAQRYLTNLGKQVSVTGVDTREDSRTRNEKVAARVEMDIRFVASEIAKYPIESADLVIALHACDTATDDALAWAVKSEAKVILAAPCCHHEINKSIKAKQQKWQFILKDGIVRERFADLVTDSLRSQILRFAGYRSEIIEFVSDQHTPRNLMIRAVRTGSPAKVDDLQAFLEFCEEWDIKPRLAQLLAAELPNQLQERLG